MEIYFPIAEISINIFAILALGLVAGIASGLFGVGGGFIMTPLLIFIGVPPAVAVGTQANQLVASSVSGVITQWRKKQVDVRMGGVLLIGGLIGSLCGMYLFGFLRTIGQIDLVIAGCYIFFLGIIGVFMLIESGRTLLLHRKSAQSGTSVSAATGRHVSFSRAGWLQKLPFRMRFEQSKLRISVLVPIFLGFFIGILVAIMGIGGGFLLVPAMIYLLGMPASLVTGTSLFQIIFITALVTILQATQHQTVDILLALCLALGSVTGAQVGNRYGSRFNGEQVRLLLAILVLSIAAVMVGKLVLPPASPYEIEVLR